MKAFFSKKRLNQIFSKFKNFLIFGKNNSQFKWKKDVFWK